MPFLVDQNGDEYVNEILTFGTVDETSPETLHAHDEDYFDENFLEPQPYQTVMPPQRRCVSHLLNLLSQDFEKQLEGQAKAAFKTTFDTLHTLWAITRVSPRAKSICKDILGETLKFPCETRWNSKFDCNKPEIQGKLNEVIGKMKRELNSNSAKNLKVLITHHFAVMLQYEKVLGPVAKSLDLLQGEYNIGQGDILPVLISMKMHITHLREINNIARDFKATILKAIDTRFGSYFKYIPSNKDFILSSISLPRYKQVLSRAMKINYMLRIC